MARTRMVASNTSIAKIAQTSKRFGNKGIRDQQFSTVEIFHYLPFDGRTTFNFFDKVNTANFPFANISENKLQVGESMTIREMWFTLATSAGGGVITSVQNFNSAGFDGLYLSQLNWLNDNNRVLKNKGLTDTKADFNDLGFSNVNNVLHLKTEITIQPLLTFVANLQTPGYVAPVNVFIGCHVKGTGTLLAPKAVY